MRNYEAEKLGTRKRIVEAFWELYKTKNIEKITVRNIADACGIYRTTFYLHFTDVYAILEKIEEDLLNELKNFSFCDASYEEKGIEPEYEFYFRIWNRAEYLHILLDGRRDPEFARIYKKELVRQMCIVHRVPMDWSDRENGIIIERIMSSLIDLFLELTEADNVAFEKLVLMIDGYIKNGVIQTLQKITVQPVHFRERQISA